MLNVFHHTAGAHPVPTALSRVGTGVPTMCLMPTTRRPDRPFRLYGTRQKPHLEGASADPDFDHVEDDYSRPKMATHRIAEIQGRTSRCGGARGGADRTRTFHNPRLLPEKTFPRISRDLRELAGQRRHRVPAPHPVGRAEPARRPHFRNRTSEQGFPRRLRRRPADSHRHHLRNARHRTGRARSGRARTTGRRASPCRARRGADGRRPARRRGAVRCRVRGPGTGSRPRRRSSRGRSWTPGRR